VKYLVQVQKKEKKTVSLQFGGEKNCRENNMHTNFNMFNIFHTISKERWIKNK